MWPASSIISATSRKFQRVLADSLAHICLCIHRRALACTRACWVQGDAAFACIISAACETIDFLGRRWQTLWETCTPLAHFPGRHESFVKNGKHSITQPKDPRLPRKCVRGVHVFHNVFQHLRRKTLTFHTFQHARIACTIGVHLNRMFSWKMLADVVEDVHPSRTFPWKT